MPSYVTVSRERHAGKAWQRPSGYSFAAAEAVLPLVAAELPKAALAMPVAFIEQDGGFRLVAVLSLQPGQSLYVAPDGRWLGGYIPAALRGYPFALLRPDAAAPAILCMDEASGLVAEAGTPGAEPFFGEDGAPAPALQQVLDFLGQVEANRAATERAVAALAAAGAIMPWPLEVETPGGRQAVAGLHRVDEARLNALDDAGFLALRKAGALAIAYAQLLSMGQLGVFKMFAELRMRLAQVQTSQQQAFADSFRLPGEGDAVQFDLSTL